MSEISDFYGIKLRQLSRMTVDVEIWLASPSYQSATSEESIEHPLLKGLVTLCSLQASCSHCHRDNAASKFSNASGTARAN